jgi:hypothetical protein
MKNKPSVRYIKKKIAQLKHCDLKTTSVEELVSLLLKLLTHYPISTRALEASPVYRARLLPSGTEPFKTKQELWYPPANIVKKLGRLNDIETSIFYCGNNKHTILEEMRPQIGEQFVFIECLLKDPKQLPMVVELGIREAMEDYHAKYKALPERWFRTLEAERGTTPNEIDQLIREFIAKEFRQRISQEDSYRYKMPIAIAELLLQPPEVDGIFYPSMELTSSAQNLALKPNSVDRLYNLNQCELVTVKDIEKLPNNAFRYAVWHSHASKQISGEGDIEWIELPDPES